MADTQDPTDHFRTTQQHAGQLFIDMGSWPGVSSIAVGVMALVGSLASAAYQHHDWMMTFAIVGVLSIVNGIVWLVIEHRRVLLIERRWQAEHSELHRPHLSAVPRQHLQSG